jgi:hypothetical protein
LSPIGYGPTPSKRKNIVLEQKVVKGFELILHRKRENIFESTILICKVSGSPFPSGGIQRNCNISKRMGGVEEISSKW